MAVNYLSHWLLTYHFLPLLQKTAENSRPDDFRIVNVTSMGHALFTPEGGIVFENIKLESASAMTRYGQSKLANIFYAKELTRKFGVLGEGKNGSRSEIWVAAVHPGNIET
ncbi:hypothetical protein GQ53DRAFT_846738 [Thozetella sp. PMI_491]|nr:hypothetical protein GQ53DRAFT_846738 [Thozetella sp. PMI_491]